MELTSLDKGFLALKRESSAMKTMSLPEKRNKLGFPSIYSSEEKYMDIVKLKREDLV
jgi:hypothetical protein